MKPIFKLLANNEDVTKKINLEASKIEFRDEEGEEADEITLNFTGTFKRPKYEDELKLWIGTKEQGLFYCGLFLVQTSRYKDGSKKSIEVTATAASFSKGLKVKRSKSYENVSIKKIASIIALRHELELKSDFEDIYIEHLEQTNESDLHFLKRLSSLYNGIFAIKNNTLIFQKKIKDKKKSKDLPRYELEVNELTSIDIQASNKTLYNSCKAIWRDTKENKQKSVTVGEGEPIKIIKDSFENVADATAKATAMLDKANSKTKTGSIDSYGFTLYAGGILILFGTLEDNGEYHIKSAIHTLDDSGWNVSFEIEN